MKCAIAFFTVLSLVLVGCASRSDGLSATSNERFGRTEVFAKLEKTPNGFRFTKLALSVPSGEDPWISLNTLEPRFGTSPEKNCVTGSGLLINQDKTTRCQSINEKLFRVPTMGVIQTAAKGLITVFSYGLTGTTRIVDVIFDRSAYEAAIIEAEKGLSLPRSDVIRLIDVEAGRLAEAGVTYRKDASRVQVKVTVTDESGFFNARDIDFKDLVSIQIAPSPRLDALDPMEIDGVLTREALLAKFALVARKIDQAELLSYGVSCGATTLKGYRFVMRCPSLVARTPLEMVDLPVQAIVKSRSFKDVRPQKFVAEDKHVRISVDGNRVVISNLVQSYIKVDAVSIYYQAKISTHQGNPISLPPLAENDSLRFASFISSLPSMSRVAVTRREAAARNVQFGLAVKYTVQGRGEFTLFKDQVIPEVDLLSSPDV